MGGTKMGGTVFKKTVLYTSELTNNILENFF